jgi:hypothetical protein
MRYYVTKGPMDEFGCTWDLSLYKVNMHLCAEVIRFYPDDTITKKVIQHVNFFFIDKYCKEITQEEYESILGL